MSFKRPYVIILLIPLFWSVWQIYDLLDGTKPRVLAVTTSKTKTVDERVASLEYRVAVLEKNAGIGYSASRKTTESFVSLSGGSISSFGWSKISGTDFTLDTSLYGKTVEVSWQGWLEGGSGGVRLYDSTNHRAVDFSEAISGGNDKRSFYTKTISIWRGQNQYYIEGKTSGGVINLTSPRLRIVAK